MPTGIKVKDAMVKQVIIAKPLDSVCAGAKVMRKRDVGSLIICDNNKACGIVTREDIVNKIVAKDLKCSEVLLKEIMNTVLVTATPDADIAEVAKLMSKHGYERIPVVDKGKLVGIISTREVAKVAPAAIEILRERLLIAEPERFTEDEFTEGECELCGNFSAELRNVNDKWVCVNCKGEAEEL
jgi:CBS domain-containing protein